MRTVNKNEIGQRLVSLLDEEHPVDEDIGIVDDNGEISGVVVTQAAYAFFLRKVEEEEDRIDGETIEKFHSSGEKDK